MNPLFFSLVRDKKAKREIEILTLLSKNDEIAIQELSELVGVSSRSITNDLRFLEQRLGDAIEIKRYKQGKIKLAWKKSKPIQETIYSLVENTLSFRLINGLFFGLKMNMDEWANYLYASRITVYRTINHISELMKEYNCYIDKCDIVKFGGEEIDIRFFLYVFYAECNSLAELKKSISEEDLVFFHAEKEVLVDYKEVSLWSIIQKMRREEGNAVTIHEKLEAQLLKTTSYQKFKENVDRILGTQTMPESEVMAGYVTLLSNVIYVKEMPGNRQLTRQDEQDIYHLIKKNLSDYLQQFSIAIDTKKILEDVLIAFFINYYWLQKLSPIFQKRTTNYIEYVMENHYQTFEKWNTMLLKNNSIFFSSYIQDIAANLAIITETILVRQKKKILICLSGEPGIKMYFGAIIENKIMSKDMEAVFLAHQNITQEYLDKEQFDLIIINYESWLSQKSNIITVSQIPTQKELETVKRIIMDL